MIGDDNDWCSVSEAARRIGVTRAAIQNRIRRHTLETMTDNHGRPLVKVVVAGGATVCAATPRKVTVAGQHPEPPQPRQDAPETVPLTLHREALDRQQATYRETVAMLRADMDADRQRHDAELARRDSDRDAERQRHLAELARMERTHQVATDSLMARVSAVLVASRPRRSWWRW